MEAVNRTFTRISTDNGLSSAQVTSILQDRQGYMWIGTAEGLNRFDGYTFTIFSQDTNNPNSIQNNFIEELFEDSLGRIWIFFPSGGISFYDPSSRSFTNYSKEWLQQQLRVYGKPLCFLSASPGPIFIGTENGLLTFNEHTRQLQRIRNSSSVVASAPVNCIYQADDNSVWIGTLDGFSLYDSKKELFIDYPIRTEENSPARSENLNGVHCIYKDKAGYLWIGTGRKGAYRSLDANGKLIFRQIGKQHVRVFRFLESKEGNLWIGHNLGATLIRKQNGEMTSTEHFFDNEEDLSPTGECLVKFIREDQSGTVWFGDSRFNQGQFCYATETGKIEQIKHQAENPGSISSNQISCQYIDRSNNLWIGHSGNGLSRCSLNKPLFDHTTGYAADPYSLSSNQVVSIFEDSQCNLWVGTSKGLDRINYNTSQIDKRFQFSASRTPNSLGGQMIGALAEDAGHNLWISYQDASPDRINLRTFRNESYQLPYRPENKTNIRNTAKVCMDYRGLIWMTTSNSGLIKYDPATGKTYFYTQPSPYPDDPEFSYNNLYSLCPGHDHTVWIGTEGKGLRCLQPDNELFTDFAYSPENSSGLSSSYIHCLYCDTYNNLWVGTNKGLNRYDQPTGTFEHFTTHDGLAGNNIQAIQEANPGILFISTNKGITRFDTRNKQMSNFSTANGLPTNDFTAGASCKLKSGKIVFGSNKGIISFHPDNLLKKSHPSYASLHISEVKANNKQEKKSVVSLSSQDAADLQISFLAFNYAYPQSNRYLYQLEGFDTNWKEAGPGLIQATYNRLPPGKYLFQVKVSDNGTDWSSPVTLPVKILPPWWHSWWFITLIILCCITILYLFYKSRVRLYQQRQADLEQKIHDRTVSLTEAKQSLEEKNKELEAVNNKLKILDEQKTAFYTNVSHELRTPLTIINGLTEYLEHHTDKNDIEKWSDSLCTIRKNTNRLTRHVNELLDLAMPDKNKPFPRISYSDLNLFLQELTVSFNSFADKCNIKYQIQISPAIQKAYFDRTILEEAVFNLLSNAFKYTPDGGEICFSAGIESETSEDLFIMTVKDTGIGIAEKEIPYLFDRYYQNKNKSYQRFESSGIGLAYTKEIIERHLGTIVCQSQSGTEPALPGSTFTITLPVSKTAYPEEWMTAEIAEPESISYNKEVTFVTPLPETDDKPDQADNRQTILFIEDNEDLCQYLAMVFREEYRVILAHNGKEGAEKALELLPDAIISDVMMPVADGIECCKQLKSDERTAHLPFILLTARAAEKQQLEGYGAGADDYISKPFNINILKAKIKSLILRKEQLQTYFKETFNLQIPDENIPDQEKEFICKATRIVLENLQNHRFDVDEFCSEMAMSRANLFRKLKATTGLSASSFTRNIRIKRAAELLRQHAYSINEVAVMVGFADPNYFSRCFKEVYGVTPSNFQ